MGEIPKVNGAIEPRADKKIVLVCGDLFDIILVALEGGNEKVGGVLRSSERLFPFEISLVVSIGNAVG